MNRTLRQHTFNSGQTLEIAQGDITAESTDAVVNAANRYLEHGAGVAGAISRKGGAQIQAESKTWVLEHGLVTHDQPAYTHGGNLPCRYIIHAVGPTWGEGDEENKLAAAITGSLRVADTLHISSIAFPAISTGVFGFPKRLAAEISFHSIIAYLDSSPGSGLNLIRLVLYDDESLAVFVDAWDADDQLSA